MRKKKEEEKLRMTMERQFFDQVGKNAADKYYINEDKRKEREGMLKGSGKVQAQSINSIFQNKVNDHKEKMNKQAEERKKYIMMMQLEKEAATLKAAENKLKLRSMQEEDMKAKEELRKQKDSLYKSHDFDDRNMLSYIYENKHHKAHDMRKRNDYLVNLMKSQFTFPQGLDGEADKKYGATMDARNKLFDEAQARKKEERKRLELETKLYQDRQVLEKQKMKEIEKQQKIIDFEATKNDAETYQKEEAKRKDVIKMKNRQNQH